MPSASRACAAGGPHRAEVAQRRPVRRRISAARTRLANRAWTGQAPRPSAPGAEHEVGVPASTGPATASRSAGSSEPSPSMKHTTPSSASAASSPAQHAAPKPRTGSSTTRAPNAAAMSPEPSVEPLSTTMGVKPGGMAAQQRGQGAGLVENGNHDIGHVRVVSNRGPETDRNLLTIR